MRRIPQFRLLLASATLLAGAVSASYAQTPAQMEYERQQREYRLQMERQQQEQQRQQQLMNENARRQQEESRRLNTNPGRARAVRAEPLATQTQRRGAAAVHRIISPLRGLHGRRRQRCLPSRTLCLLESGLGRHRPKANHPIRLQRLLQWPRAVCATCCSVVARSNSALTDSWEWTGGRRRRSSIASNTAVTPSTSLSYRRRL